MGRARRGWGGCWEEIRSGGWSPRMGSGREPPRPQRPAGWDARASAAVRAPGRTAAARQVWVLLIQEVGAQAVRGARAPRLAGVALRSLKAGAPPSPSRPPTESGCRGPSGCSRTELWGHFGGDVCLPAFLSRALALCHQAAAGWTSGFGAHLGVTRPPALPSRRRPPDGPHAPRAHHPRALLSCSLLHVYL